MTNLKFELVDFDEGAMMNSFSNEDLWDPIVDKIMNTRDLVAQSLGELNDQVFFIEDL